MGHSGDGKEPEWGTGFLVNIQESNKFCIMTAAHNIFLKGVGKVQEIQAEFQNGLTVTASRDECFASKVFESNPAESSGEDSSFFDYGLIAVNKNKNPQSRLDPGGCAFSVLLKGHELLHMHVSVHGYKKGEETQTENASGLDHLDNEALYYTKNTTNGVSGGPVFVVVDGIHTAVGIQ
jgi:V8-like Glu-specific endopeptidase